MNQVAIYARKSTESEDKQVMSIQSQVHELRLFAEKMNWQVTCVFTESKSAKAPGREVFNEMCDEIQKGRIKELLCWKLDRLARNPVDGGALIWSFEERKLIQIHTPQRSFANSGNDKFWLQLEFGMAKKYVDDLSDNVKRGLKTRVESGWYPSQAPLGYLNDAINRTIIKDPDRFPLVKKMWQLLLTGNYSPHRIVKIANDVWRLRSKPYRSGGNYPISTSYIYIIFTNPFYYGVFNYNGTIYPGKHPPMISKRQFDKAQKIMKRDFTTRPKKHEFAYTGLIKCGKCGAAITAEHKTNRFGSKYIYYHCTRRKKATPCFQPCIQEKDLEKQILEFLNTINIEENTLKIVLEILQRENNTFKEEEKTILRNHQKQLTECEKNLSELLNIKLRGLLSDEEFKIKRNELDTQKRQLENSIKQKSTDTGSGTNKAVELFKYASKVVSVFENGSLNEKKSILRYVSSNPTLSDKKLNINAALPFSFIQTSNKSDKLKIGRFEPRNLGLYNTQTATQSDGFCADLGLVENVRTYFTKISSFPQNGGS